MRSPRAQWPGPQDPVRLPQVGGDVAGEHDLETGGLQRLLVSDEGVAAVPPDPVVHVPARLFADLLLGLEEVGEHEQTAGPQHPVDLRVRLGLVGNQAHCVLADDVAERPVGVRHGRRRAVVEGEPEAGLPGELLTGELDALLAQVEAVAGAAGPAGEVEEVVAAAAAHVEHVRVRPQLGVAGEDLRGPVGGRLVVGVVGAGEIPGVQDAVAVPEAEVGGEGGVEELLDVLLL